MIDAGKFLAAFAITVIATASASASTIGFEVAPPGLFVVPATPYSESGFTFTSNLGTPLNGIFDGADPFSNTNGTDIFGWCPEGCPGQQIITMTGLSTFSIASIDIGYSFLSSFMPGMSVDLTGYFSGGGSIFVSLPVTQDWTTHGLVGFSGLSSLDISAVDPTATGAFPSGIDNLVVMTGAVPEPSSMLFLAAGLVALAFRRRR